jgi:hypothetical protein
MFGEYELSVTPSPSTSSSSYGAPPPEAGAPVDFRKGRGTPSLSGLVDRVRGITPDRPEAWRAQGSSIRK